jgi:flagellar M-ring protein FliF
MEKARRNRFIILVASGVAVIILVAIFLSQKSYAVLYTDMRAEDAGEVLDKLTGLGYEAKTEGVSTILVESSKVDEARIKLAAEGYPQSGYNDFTIMERGGGLGQTEFEKNAYYQFQVSEFIRQAINLSEKIDDSMVIINFASESNYVLAADRTPASATVVLTLIEDAKLTDTEAYSIYALVSKSVPGLTEEEIRIVDSKMNLYEVKKPEDATTLESMTEQLQLQQMVKERIQKQVENLLAPVFGPNGFITEVNVVLDFNAESEQNVVFTPPVEGSDSGLAVSYQELYEQVRNSEEGGVVGFDPNGAADIDQYQEVLTDSGALYTSISREANLEINETRRQIEKAKGRVADLSVGIMLNNADDELEDYTEQLKAVVANAIGVTQSRVSVEMLPFAPVEEMDLTEAYARRDELIRQANLSMYIRWGIIALTVIVIMVIALMITRTLRRPKHEEAKGQEGEGIDVVAGGETLMTPDEAMAILEREDTNLASLENYIENSPESVAQLLRNWLSDDTGR